MPLPLKLESVPPVTATSETAKLVEASLSVKVSVVVSPAIRLDLLALKAIVGITVSIARVRVLLLSEPSALVLLVASVNTPFATLTVPLVVLLAVGVNSAV